MGAGASAPSGTNGVQPSRRYSVGRRGTAATRVLFHSPWQPGAQKSVRQPLPTLGWSPERAVRPAAVRSGQGADRPSDVHRPSGQPIRTREPALATNPAACALLVAAWSLTLVGPPALAAPPAGGEVVHRGRSPTLRSRVLLRRRCVLGKSSRGKAGVDLARTSRFLLPLDHGPQERRLLN
jgi:hypothetical protein